MIIGHSISNASGILQAIDEPVAMLLQRTQKHLIGLSYLAITHAADMARSLNRVAALQTNGGPSMIRKRYIGGEGGIITLDVQVSRLGNGDSSYLVGTFATVNQADLVANADKIPQRLWLRAKDLLGVMRARDAALGADIFADHAWGILLLIYLSEAESWIATPPAIADHLALPATTVERWLRVLLGRDLIEPVDSLRNAVQLSPTGIRRVERLLQERPAETAARSPV
jgi:hypothetical protein